MSGRSVCGDFLELTLKGFDLNRTHMSDMNHFLIYCITGIVGYPKHSTEPKYLEWSSKNQFESEK